MNEPSVAPDVPADQFDSHLGAVVRGALTRLFGSQELHDLVSAFMATDTEAPAPATSFGAGTMLEARVTATEAEIAKLNAAIGALTGAHA